MSLLVTMKLLMPSASSPSPIRPAQLSLMISSISVQGGWNSVPHSTVNDSAFDFDESAMCRPNA